MSWALPRMVATAGAIAVVLALLTSSAAVSVASPSKASEGTELLPALALPPNPYSTGMPASLALGQPGLASASVGHGPSNLTFPDLGAAFGPNGSLWVTDTTDNRVLEYLPPFSTGMNALVALGQTSLNGSIANTTQSGLWEPEGLAFDSAGDLWVADSTNNRVLEFTPPFTTGMNAKVVLGQAGFLTRTNGTTTTNFTHPTGLAFGVSGDLFVADALNNRILVFAPPFVSGETASYVIGQSGFTSAANGTTATTLSTPTDVAVGPSGAIWVVDSMNNRALEFAPPFSDGMAAVAVLGQANLTSRSEGPPYGLESPSGLAFDASGDLWVADTRDNRAVEYPASLTSSETPTVVLGQSTWSGTARGTTALNLSGPSVPAVGPTGDLWVVDSGNSRVVEYTPTAFALTAFETGLPNGTAWSVTVGGAVKTAVAPNSIPFAEVNGSYPFSAGGVPGYSASPTSGTETVNGTAVNFTIAYSATSTSSSSSTLVDLLWIVFVVLAVILLILYLMERRRRRKTPAAAPSGWTPPGTVAPPPGASGAPPPASGPGGPS